MPQSRAHRRATECPGKLGKSAGRADALPLPLVVLILREHIASATHRNDPARVSGVILKGSADARNVHINAAVERLKFLPTDVVHESFARHDPPRMEGQDAQQLKLIARPWSLHPVDSYHAGITINPQTPEPQRRRACHPRESTTAQDRPQACQQLARIKGFWQIIIAAEF